MFPIGRPHPRRGKHLVTDTACRLPASGTNTSSVGLGRHQSALAKLVGIATEGCHGHWSLLRGRQAHQANDARMWPAMHDRQLAEVLVEGQDHLPSVVGMRENGDVAWVGWPVSYALDFVPDLSQRSCHGASHTTVDQDPQALWL